jgi:hypothetical protein
LRVTERLTDLRQRHLLEQEVDRDGADADPDADLDNPTYDCVTS